MDVRIANSTDPDQKKQSDQGLHCLPRLFWQANRVQNFRTFTIMKKANTAMLIRSPQAHPG